MRHQDFNIIFQPPKDATSGFVIIKKCRFKSRSYSSLVRPAKKVSQWYRLSSSKWIRTFQIHWEMHTITFSLIRTRQSQSLCNSHRDTDTMTITYNLVMTLLTFISLQELLMIASELMQSFCRQLQHFIPSRHSSIVGPKGRMHAISAFGVG